MKSVESHRQLTQGWVWERNMREQFRLVGRIKHVFVQPIFSVLRDLRIHSHVRRVYGIVLFWIQFGRIYSEYQNIFGHKDTCKRRFMSFGMVLHLWPLHIEEGRNTRSANCRYFIGRLRRNVSEGLNVHQHCHRNLKSRKRGNVYREIIDWVCVTFDSWQKVGVWNDRAVCGFPRFNFWIIWPKLRKLSHLRPLPRRSCTISNNNMVDTQACETGGMLATLIVGSWYGIL